MSSAREFFDMRALGDVHTYKPPALHMFRDRVRPVLEVVTVSKVLTEKSW